MGYRRPGEDGGVEVDTEVAVDTGVEVEEEGAVEEVTEDMEVRIIINTVSPIS